MRRKNGQFRKKRNPIIRRLFLVECSNCGVKRKKCYKDYWAIKKGKTSSRCFKCSRFKKGETNSGGFKKGVVPWNIGIGKADYWHRIKNSKEWKEVRKKVFERDNYTCVWCGIRGTELHLDHLRTLCKPCHKKTDTYGYKAKNYKVTNK